MPAQDGIAELRAASAIRSGPPSNIVEFPRQHRISKPDGLSLLPQAHGDFLQIVEDLTLLNAVLAELRDLALSVQAKEETKAAVSEPTAEEG